MRNLASLIGAASRIHAGENTFRGKACTGPQELAALGLFDELRIYYPREPDRRRSRSPPPGRLRRRPESSG